MPPRFLSLALFASSAYAAAQQPIPLHDGAHVSLHGTLAMAPAGRLQFVAVKTVTAYTPILIGKAHQEHAAAATHTLGLSGYQRYTLLYAHRGQPVTVIGTVMTSDASPYYLHNVSLTASSIRLANGTELIGSPRAGTPLAVDVGEYRASVVLPADPAQPWQYTAHGQPDTESRFLSCSSNGGGDVVNCSCGVGFRAIRTESSVRGMDARIFADSHTAQFGPVDARHRVELSVTCSR